MPDLCVRTATGLASSTTTPGPSPLHLCHKATLPPLLPGHAAARPRCCPAMLLPAPAAAPDLVCGCHEAVCVHDDDAPVHIRHRCLEDLRACGQRAVGVVQGCDIHQGVVLVLFLGLEQAVRLTAQAKGEAGRGAQAMGKVARRDTGQKTRQAVLHLKANHGATLGKKQALRSTCQDSASICPADPQS